jgi:TonB family protein
MAETWKQWEGTIVDGKFRLEQFLGGSEHSAVFLTEAGSPATKAAIKFVPATPQALDFQRTSWEQTSRLSHAHLMRLFGSGQCRFGNLDLVYAVMEYGEENLAQILPERALSAAEARDVLGPMLQTLQYLHAKGLVHGALKPANVLAVQDQLKLSSDQIRPFGKPGLVQESTIHAAPELAREGAGAPSDVWSLGVTLVEVLTQRAPERSSTGQTVVPSNLPAPFGEIVGHCLIERPQDRWTPAQIAQRLSGAPPLSEPADVSLSPRPDLSATPRPSESRTVGANEPERYSAQPISSGRRLMVPGITLLAILVVLYAGSQFLHRSHETSSAAAPPTSKVENTNNPSTTGSGSSGRTERSSADSPAKSSDTPNAATGTPSTRMSSPGRVLERVEPNVSGSARSTITGKIHVRVGLRVDPSGRVADARLLSPGPSHYFASRALEAARHWTFVPPQISGEPSSSKWVLTFTFTRKAADVSAQESGS